MQTHFTAWLSTDRSVLDGDFADVVVLADEPHSYVETDDGIEEVSSWTSAGDPVWSAVTTVDITADDGGDAELEARDLLEAAGWRLVGRWEGVPTGLIVEVERATDETWTLQQAADHMQTSTPKVAAQALRRLGVEAVGRQPGRSGQSIYLTADVIYAQATRPGQGTRTDLKED